MICPKCGTENPDQVKLCSNCDEALLTDNEQSAQIDTEIYQSHNLPENSEPHTPKQEQEQEQEQEQAPATTVNSGSKNKQQGPGIHQRISDIDFSSSKPQSGDKPVVSKGLNIGIFIATLIFPIVGIAMGFTYMRKEQPEAKRAGKNWLIFGLIIFVVNIILINANR